MKLVLFTLLALTACVEYNGADIGHEYIGAKYALDPLGEEKAPDSDPLIRFDSFDCTTFVETSLANGNVSNLNKIRYKNGEIDFLNRNHFIETDWLPNNSNILQDITEQYGHTDIRKVVIDKQAWLNKVFGIKADFPKEEVSLNYIPYSELRPIKPKKALIVLFISGKSEKSAKIGTDIAVVHMGFLLPDGTLRHASSQYGRVMDTDFYEYAMKRAKNKDNLGIMLVSIKNE